jgi:transposase
MTGDDGPHRVSVVLREVTAVHRVGDEDFPLQGLVSRQAPGIGDRAGRDGRPFRRPLIGAFKHNLTGFIFDSSALEQSCQGHAGPLCVADGAKLPLCAISLRDQKDPAIAGALQRRDRHARAALSVQINKSDANDADGLAQIVRTGWNREVGVKSVAAHLVRATLGVRKQLVGMRTEMINQIRGLMKIFGLILPKGSGTRFEASVRARLAEQAELGSLIEPLLTVWHAVDDQVAALERQLVRRARRHEACHRLMTVPGVGPLTALAFVTTVDDPARFRRSSSVGAYLGLTPRRHQSGERDVSGRISKCGDRLTRSYLFEAANVLLTRVERWSSLKAWAIRLAKRSGAKKAKVALARRLAALLHRLWQDGTTFRWTTEAAA